jgi:hypothetical protein
MSSEETIAPHVASADTASGVGRSETHRIKVWTALVEVITSVV